MSTDNQPQAEPEIGPPTTDTPAAPEIRLEIVARDEAELVMLLELVDLATRELLRRVWLWRAGILLDQAEQARRVVMGRALTIAPLAIEG